MRDGVALATDVYRPADLDAAPVILMRTPYGRGGLERDARFFAGHGFVVAAQDVRGKGGSEGLFEFYSHDLTDFRDTVAWILEQSWSTPAIGTYGCSYLGEVQIIQATTLEPALKAMIPQASAGGTGTAGGRYRYFSGVVGGAYELHQALGWFPTRGQKDPRAPTKEIEVDFETAQRILPLNSIMSRIGAPPNDFDTIISTPLDSPYWSAKGFLDDGDAIDAPALFVNSWYDYGVGDTLHQFEHFRGHTRSDEYRSEHRLVIGPGIHCATEEATARTVVGERNLGDARIDLWSIYLRWFDAWLRDNRDTLDDLAKVHYYVMGRNVWRTSDSWPVPGTRLTPLFLASDGEANSANGNGRLTFTPPARARSDTFVYDPDDPVPSLGGPLCCTTSQEALPGSYDQRPVEARPDVLVYTTEPLAEEVEVTGPIAATLYLSSDVPDTDLTAKLVDVYPDGRAFNVQEGILRVRYREGFDRQVFMEPNTVYEVTVDMQATSNVFLRGHKIRLEISSSNFPRFDRNLNTGGRNFDESTWRKARNTIHHTPEHRSRLLLPVVEDP